MSGWVTVLVAVLGGGVGGRLLFFRPERDKMVAEASNHAIAAVNASLTRLQGDLVDAYKRIDRLQADNDQLRHEVSELRRQQELCADCPWKGVSDGLRRQ